ncbi:MAG: Lpg1974 family pore-forming outer membrane protein, partial [Desulfosarcinaceae bacterium]
MRMLIVAVMLVLCLPIGTWAQEPSNEELLNMIRKLESRFDAVLEQTRTARAEADQAKAEAAAAREEADKAKAELARLKANQSPGAKAETMAEKSLVRVPATGPAAVISVESVYLRPSRSGLDFAVADSFNDPDRVRGSYKKVDPDYSSGWRAGIKIEAGSGRDFGLKVGKVTGRDSASAEAEPGGTLWGTWLHPNSIIDDNDVDSAEASYDWEQTVFDFSVGQQLNIGKNLDLRLEAGLRHARVNQEIEIMYLQDVSAVADRKDYITNKNEFTGWGPRVGIDFDWKLAYGFDLFGSFGGSLLMGDFDVRYKETDGQVFTDGTPDTLQKRIDVEESYDRRLVPVAEVQVGLGYVYPLKNNLKMGVKIGYEYQNWFNMVTSQGYMDDVDSQLMETDTTDLSFCGYFFQG